MEKQQDWREDGACGAVGGWKRQRIFFFFNLGGENAEKFLWLISAIHFCFFSSEKPLKSD